MVRRALILLLCLSIFAGMTVSASAATLSKVAPSGALRFEVGNPEAGIVAKETTRLAPPKKFSLYLGEFKRLPLNLRYRGTPDEVSVEYDRDDRVDLLNYYMQLFLFGLDTGDVTTIFRSGTKRATTIISVKLPPTTGIEIDGNVLRLNQFESFDITRAVIPYTAIGQLRWSSDNARVASVSKNGIVTAKKAGVAIVNAKTKSGSKFVGSVLVLVG